MTLQVIIDQYIATGEVKWGYSNGLVLLLPHGHEGAGPEHSSAFIARFLQLCAEDNMRVAMPSESSQLYHLLRRQALTDERKPLIVMTAKLRLHGQEESYSRLHHLAHGEFRPILRERVEVDAAKVVRAIVTSGKLYYDLANERTRANLEHTPILRLEQLYPFPNDALVAELARFPALRELVWAQEEAKNHGAWHLLRDQLETTLPPGVSLAYAGRPTAAASAVCDARRHAAEQQRVIATAGTCGTPRQSAGTPAVASALRTKTPAAHRILARQGNLLVLLFLLPRQPFSAANPWLGRSSPERSMHSLHWS